MPHYEMTSINEEVLSIRLGAPGGNEPIYIQRNPEALFVDGQWGCSPKFKAEPSFPSLLFLQRAALQLQRGRQPSPNRKWAPAGEARSALFP